MSIYSQHKTTTRKRYATLFLTLLMALTLITVGKGNAIADDSVSLAPPPANNSGPGESPAQEGGGDETFYSYGQGQEEAEQEPMHEEGGGDENTVQESWVVPSGVNLQDVLYQWCQKSGWSLVWNSEYAYMTQAGTTLKSDFETAVKTLFTAMDTANPRIYPVMYRGNKVIVVKNTPTH